MTELRGLSPIIYGKVGKKQVILGFGKSIVSSLSSYWRTLLLHYKLDVIHIEKNVCESL